MLPTNGHCVKEIGASPEVRLPLEWKCGIGHGGRRYLASKLEVMKVPAPLTPLFGYLGPISSGLTNCLLGW